MNRPTLLHHAVLLSLALLVSACANGGGARSAADTSTLVSADSAAAAAVPTQPDTDAMSVMPAPVENDAAPIVPTAYAAPQPYDPWEKFNRRAYAFNVIVDRTIAKPLAKAYVKVVPEPARNGVTNFFNNLGQPVTIVNALLQGKGKVAAQSVGRFTLNTMVGIGGIFDPATRVKIPNRREDFGQTLGVWGWKRSRYLELPLFGPSTVRDIFGIVGDATLSPLRFVREDETRIFLQGLKLVDLRMRLLPLDDMLVGATDEYELVRDSWLARRDYKISGGGAKIEDSEQPLPEYLREDNNVPSAPAHVVPIIPAR
jgi:phospholipid-binding lipoprotein MlaA